METYIVTTKYLDQDSYLMPYWPIMYVYIKHTCMFYSKVLLVQYFWSYKYFTLEKLLKFIEITMLRSRRVSHVPQTCPTIKTIKI